jgi:hypothetical protein
VWTAESFLLTELGQHRLAGVPKEERGEENMNKKILLLGVLDSILAEVEQQVARPGFEFFRGTSVEDVRATLARTNIDQVIMGGGLPLETRLEMVREIFLSSDTANVHMKSHIPRSEGFLPFVQAVLRGFSGDEG